jgi:hypothetical protein
MSPLPNFTVGTTHSGRYCSPDSTIIHI